MSIDIFEAMNDLVNDRMDKVFGNSVILCPSARSYTTGNSNNNTGSKAPFAVDYFGDAKQYTLIAELPGVEKENIEVSVDRNVLSISTENKALVAHEGENKPDFYCKERRFGKQTRTFKLPDDCDQENIKSSFENGLLRLVFEKSPELAKRRIIKI